MRPELRPLALLRTAASLPPREVLRRSRRLAAIIRHAVQQRLADIRERVSHGTGQPGWPAPRFGPNAVLPVIQPATTTPGADPDVIHRLLARTRDALDHRFDLLGSGPVRPSYDFRAAGLGGHRYYMAPGHAEGRRQRARMHQLAPQVAAADASYEPIDWHVDFRSGYRWDPGTWFQHVSFGHAAGVDIKVPWELSRFQHVAPMALVTRLAPDSPEAGAVAHEFARQVVDWIAANPVRRGVNWTTPMDVALRALSWLCGVALLGDKVLELDRFEALICGSLAQHGRHIERNLEYDPSRSGNHYLSNVVGLIALGAALPDLPDADRWLVYGLQELEAEMRHQVLPDGVDVEGSTTYHAFVAEMFAVGAAIAARVPEERRLRLEDVEPGPVAHPLAPPLRPLEEQAFDLRRQWIFSPEFLSQLRGMAVFAAEMTKPDGCLPQIGDQDDGRTLVLVPPTDPRDWRIVPALVGRLLGDPALEAGGAGFELQARLIAPERGSLSTGLVANGPGTAVARETGEGGTVVHFRASGMVVGRADDLFLAAHAGTLSPRSPGGHFHNDLLSFELHWRGADIVVDPGSFVYTALPAARDAYRSTAAHSTVAITGHEQRRWPSRSSGLFTIARDADHASFEGLGPRRIRGVCEYGSVRHMREWEWSGERLEIRDRVSAPTPATAYLNLAPQVVVEGAPRATPPGWEIRLRCPSGRFRIAWKGVRQPIVGEGLYSPGYGRERSGPRLTAELSEASAVMVIEWVS